MPAAARAFIIPLIVATALFMENLDSTVIATALPAISRSLNESPLTLNMAITCYLLSLAVFIPVSGWVADRFGARRVFQGAILVFLLGSIGCGLSQNLWQMVAARTLQGMGGAMMVPVGRLVILRTVEKSQLVKAMAYLTVPALLGPVLGPPVGGFITTYFTWRWIFWINVPIGLVGLYLAQRVIPDLKEPVVPRLDGRGFLLSGLGLSGLVFGFETLGRDVLPDWMTGALLSGGAFLVLLYCLHARRAQAPLLDLTLLKVPTFRASVTGGLLFRIGMGALPFLLPLMLQLGFGLNPLQSGLLTFAGAAGALTMKFVAGPILRRLGFRRVLIANTVLCAGFLALNALFTPATPHWLMLGCFLAGGFFRSLEFTAVNALGYADIAKERMSRASAFASMAQQLSLSIGVGLGALALHFTLAYAGTTTPAAGDFAPAFLVVAFVTLLAVPIFLALPDHAGAEVSGRRKPAPAAPVSGGAAAE